MTPYIYNQPSPSPAISSNILSGDYSKYAQLGLKIAFALGSIAFIAAPSGPASDNNAIFNGVMKIAYAGFFLGVAVARRCFAKRGHRNFTPRYSCEIPTHELSFNPISNTGEPLPAISGNDIIRSVPIGRGGL